MYEGPNRNKINMIGTYLILYYNTNEEEKAAKLMTIAKSDIDNISKSGPSNTLFLEFTSTSFGKESNKALLSITEYYWMSKTIYDTKICSKMYPFQLIKVPDSIWRVQFFLACLAERNVLFDGQKVLGSVKNSSSLSLYRTRPAG